MFIYSNRNVILRSQDGSQAYPVRRGFVGEIREVNAEILQNASANGYVPIVSTVAGETADSLIFFPIALGGIVPAENLLWMMFWQILLKTLYEIIVLPLTVRVVRRVKAYEGVDVYDRNISYNILKVSHL